MVCLSKYNIEKMNLKKTEIIAKNTFIVCCHLVLDILYSFIFRNVYISLNRKEKCKLFLPSYPWYAKVNEKRKWLKLLETI